MVANQLQARTAAAKGTVLSFIQALNNFDYARARTLVNDNFRFEGVLGSREGADVYFRDMEQMKLSYQVHRAFAEGNDVCVLYDVFMPGNKSVFAAGWYTVDSARIRSLKVVFDPRPVTGN